MNSIATEPAGKSIRAPSPAGQMENSMSSLRRILDQYRDDERGLPSYLELCGIEAQHERLAAALLKIIEMTRQTAQDKYGDAEKAEQWSCVVIARAALAAAEAQP